MREFYDKQVKFDSKFRLEDEEKFNCLCSSEFDIFKKLFLLGNELDEILYKRYQISSEEKEYYTILMHIRCIDHFMSANLLYAKGYVVDSITLVRSAIEAMWVIQNFWHTQDYFFKWRAGCKIVPSKIRKCDNFDEDTKKFHDSIYESLCNISHCRINSIEVMSKTHGKILRDDSQKEYDFKKSYKVVIGGFYIYLLGITNALKTKKYCDKLKSVNQKIREISLEDVFFG